MLAIRTAIWSAEDDLLSHLPAASRETLQTLLQQARVSTPPPSETVERER